ncbi:WD40-repeat-containing domain protein [Crepidotus variabilis]|uniref:WD40-repeat-containing domain protein n=1 Tax=Crepidotus variabilis TaxID=179855 RepID=A0A9P6ECX9_9AGAR|nr:WD40-repeat-containing domain protein [Crepidotus variabilis]
MDTSATSELDLDLDIHDSPRPQIPLIPTRSFFSLAQSQTRPIFTTRASSSSSEAPYILQISPLRTPSSSYYATTISHPSNAIELFDALSLRTVLKFVGHRGGTCALENASNLVGLGGGKEVLLSAGKDGNVVVWDERAKPNGGVCVKMSAPSNTPLLSLAVHPSGAYVAAGSALHSGSSGNEASILYWDPRQPSFPLRAHNETHSDDITSLAFLPSVHLSASSTPVSTPPSTQEAERPQDLLLSSSSDGLLALSDPNEQDGDEAVWRVANWGCSISQAGFHRTGDVWAASDMETFSLWSDELDPISDIDIRIPSYHPSKSQKPQNHKWETDYLIAASSTRTMDSRLGIWTGNNAGDVALLSTSGTNPPSNKSEDAKWYIHETFRSGHEGIVRGLFWDEDNNLLITGGEDAKLNVWPKHDFSSDDLLPAAEDDAEMELGSPMRMDDSPTKYSPRKEKERKKKHRKRERVVDDDDEDGNEERADEEGMDLQVESEEERDGKRKGKRARR